ncbi:MAG: hypothetical protein JO076_07970, partial [Verrucomicrobia bacterium]|nr:hypothetical protein [Verrucomicrobiota bacterium]
MINSELARFSDLGGTGRPGGAVLPFFVLAKDAAAPTYLDALRREGYGSPGLRTFNLFQRRILHPHSLFPFVTAALLFYGNSDCAFGDPISDLRSVSIFKDADLGKLANGEILAGRGPAMSLGRALSVESAYIVPDSLRTAVSLQEKWNPSGTAGVFLQSDLPAHPSPTNFQGLTNLPQNFAVRSLFQVTERLPGDASKLLLSNAEAHSFSSGGSAAVVGFWSKVLAARANAFTTGGLGALPPYETDGSNIRPADEFTRLLRESPRLQSQFSSIIGSTPLSGGRGSIAPSGYWQVFDVEGLAAVGLGASYGKGFGEGWQSVDMQYYSSAGVYALVTFYQMWPIRANGRESTLVWRTDLTSAAAIGELRGV